jgi:hypothetical protein
MGGHKIVKWILKEVDGGCGLHSSSLEQGSQEEFCEYNN